MRLTDDMVDHALEISIIDRAKELQNRTEKVIGKSTTG